MDTLTIKAREKDLKRQLEKSLKSVRLTNDRLTMADKARLKRAAVGTLQRFMKAEIRKNAATRTYDWYFYKEEGELYDILFLRNDQGTNRYFIVVKSSVPLNAYGGALSVGSGETVRQLDITNKEVIDIISGSKRLFSQMIKITVSEKEDARIYGAFRNVDKKSLIGVTVGLPAVLIGAVEAVPFLLAASESGAAGSIGSSLGRAFAVNSGRVALGNGLSDGLSQYTSNLLSIGEIGINNLKKIDAFDMLVSATFSGLGSMPLKSELDYTWDKGLKVNDTKKFSENMMFGTLSFKVGKVFGNEVGKPLTSFGGSTGKLFYHGGQFTLKTVIASAKKEINKEK